MDSGGRIRATAPSGGDSLPSGIVCAWFLSATPPTGFVACNGSNGTDDLRGRFLRGTPAAGTVGDTGGSDSHSHTGGSHTHGATLSGTHGHTHTLEVPAHSHDVTVTLEVCTTLVGCGADKTVLCGVTVSCACSGSCGPLSLDGSIADCDISVTGTTDNGGDVATSETTTLPPYEDVLWIMKV